MEGDLSNVSDLPTWELAHIMEHARLGNRAARAGTVVPAYPLNYSFTRDWLIAHDDEHRALRHKYAVKETRNFAQLDPSDQDAIQAWLLDHYVEHQQLSAAAG
jgi:hypothetical protein